VGEDSNMRAKIRNRDDSIWMRLPKNLADDLGLAVGSIVELTVERGRLLISPVVEPTYSLAKLVEGITARNRHTSQDWGAPLGREFW
jgi:antitoxin MazE